MLNDTPGQQSATARIDIPKTCGCGRVHDAAGWAALDLAGSGLMDDGEGGFLELRNCACGSTLAIEAPKGARVKRPDPFDPVPCPECKGEGVVPAENRFGAAICNRCQGEGRVPPPAFGMRPRVREVRSDA